ncbi:DDE-type integrase/transposase/recombinase [Citricoccus sp. NR2]|uniref:DDE-type integrase/transposase/recombinase n=1 Tax=Citricoccus sp. NR2 TaxID=3004095 RepID=UPI0022DD783A|nr:DDE-type integrase/transposase/recombinase [Citricoccus sp. NR2]WBL19189.1 DDE-type integrase/transposase/recombinase [Citricoccus sp. NR2]WBL19307.1 DDE-type integrase/transposase/recombinase [Citricoccus sp. NR2]WBL20057.1 DDE-type integrase/transposase/recombinase [Citricoccus sp. NR2]
MTQRKAITAAQAKAWPKATKTEKAAILDAVVHVTGWHRDHARKMLRRAATGETPGPRKTREPVRRYSQETTEALVRCWALLDGITAKRLTAALPRLLTALERLDRLEMSPETQQQLLSMSPATMDRHLKPYRQGLIATRGIAHTKPGSLLKSSIPMKTWAEWDDTTAGFIEIDLVGHEGGDNNGCFYYSLNATDVATGWTETCTVRSKGERIVATGLDNLINRFPFLIMGIHSDNGSEFINHHLAKYCRLRQLTFTRGRPSHSNDQGHVEQKNWSIVRRAVGYWRYDTARELDLLNQLWPAQNDRNNLLMPSQKLISKTRHGAKVTKRYDTATTPADRLLRDHAEVLDTKERDALQHRLDTVNPIELGDHIELIQANLFELAKRRAPVQQRAKRNRVYVSGTKLDKRASLDESTTRTTRAS